MIVVAALAIALATPQQNALIDLWQSADRTHTAARLDSAPAAIASRKVTPNLPALAARELAIPGRYEIAGAPVSEHEPWWLRPWRWLHDRWQSFWRSVFGHVHVGREAAANIGDVILAILGLVLIVVAVRLLLNLQLARDATRAAAAPLEAPPSPRALYRAACTAAAKGDYGAATLLLFAATIALLERRGDLRATRSATVADLRGELRTNDAKLLIAFDAIAALFVQRAYAERQIEEWQWESARAAFDRDLTPPQHALQP